MPHLPAFCDNCDAVFNSGIFVENSFNNTFVNCASGPCPKCGSMGHIPDGIYNVFGNIIELLAGPERSVQDLQRLAELIKRAQEKNASPKEVSQEIKKKIPNLQALADFIPDVPEKLMNWTVFLAAIVTLIGFLQSSSCETGDISGADTDQLINESIERSYEIEKNAPKPPAEKQTEPKTESAPDTSCPCGSGRIYKECCMII
ncbi:MAG: SEC-C domain-containing protein [Nitrospinae bacterium]|nr:SEC-C domain-containing protein [Nitrospinota bacterium]